MSDIKRIGIKEFREKGFLQEANRQFFHPLGLALEVSIDNETGEEKLNGVWDYRNDAEGILFGDNTIDTQKVADVKSLYDEKSKVRMERYGFIVQPAE